MAPFFFISSNITLWLLVVPFFGAAGGISIFFLSHSITHGIVSGVLFGVTGGLGLWLAARRFFGLRYCLCLGVLTGLSLTSLVWIFIQNVLLCLVIFLIISSAVTKLFKPINLKATDQLSRIEMNDFDWSLRAAIYGFFKRMPIGIILGLATGSAIASIYGWVKGLLVGTGLMILASIGGGLQYGNTDFRIRDAQSPNESTWRTLRNSLKLAVVSALSVGIIMGWIISILTNSADGRIAGLLFLFAGLGAGIDLGGGFPAIQHFILRILLWRMEGVPLTNYPKFLNHAVYHIFLLRVGSGYIFIHRLLLDYLASRNLSA